MSNPVNPLSQQLHLLLGAYGYNLYDNRNRMRADDLLVRERAAGALAEAANALRALRSAYHARFIPMPTREQPDPPAERMAQLAAMTRLQERLSDLETLIRSMPVPTQDRVWERFRQETTLLNELLLHDYHLITPCQALAQQALMLTPDSWGPETEGSLQQAASQAESAIRARAMFLSAPG